MDDDTRKRVRAAFGDYREHADYVAAQPTTPSVVPLPRVGEGGVAR